MITSNARKVVGGVMVAMMLTGGVAHAASVATTGATASNVGRTLTIRDTQADGSNAYANWNSSDRNRVQTSGGNGSTATVTPSVLNNFRACRDRNNLPDNCSSYVSP